jgi:citrate lyase subunit beta/citryl-CoA lyase
MGQGGKELTMTEQDEPRVGRVRRSLHFVPGANEKLLEKSLGLPADSLILDLEDAVTPENKETARATISRWLGEVDFDRQERVVRINALDTPWAEHDIDETMQAPPDAYLIPKVRGPADLQRIDELLTRAEARHGYPAGEVRLLVLATETPQGLFNIRKLGSCPRVDALTWGPEDLAAAIGARRNRDEQGQFLEIFRFARSMTLLAAAAAEVQPVDTVYVDIRDTEGLRRECQEAAWMGFTGKLTIHPAQVELVNEAFTPSAQEISECQELLEAFEENRKSGVMAFRFRGQMVDAPHLVRAQRTLERARQAGVI